MAVLRLKKRLLDRLAISLSRDDAARLSVGSDRQVIELDRAEFERLRAEGKSLDLDPGDIEELVVRRTARTAHLDLDGTKGSLGGNPNRPVTITPRTLQRLMADAPPPPGVSPARRGASLLGTSRPNTFSTVVTNSRTETPIPVPML